MVKVRDDAYSAKFVSQSETDPIVMAAGSEKTVKIKFKNTGAISWNGGSGRYISAYTMEPRERVSIFRGSGWASAKQTGKMAGIVKPGGVGELAINLKAPEEAGDYTEKFYLAAENYSWVKGGYFYLEIKVEPTLSVAAVIPDEAATTTLSEVVSSTPFIPRLSEEPKIRVGVWKPQSVVQFVSFEDDYKIFDGEKEAGVLPKKYITILNYVDGIYSFNGAGINFTTNNFIRLEPVTSWRSVFLLYNYEHLVSWKGPMNFNKYRGALEYRLSEKGTIYAINDVLFEDYIAGISETSSGAPLEFIKANLVAARSYAYHTKEDTNKHNSRYFDVVSTTGDQLYLGVVSEELMPRVVEAASSTRGMMVTYDDKIVTAPYFGNSNGWTKSYTSVWGGAKKPWLVPVKANYDAGRARLGHGVGMSQRDCSIRAKKQGLDYVALLKYYYTGVEVERIYN